MSIENISLIIKISSYFVMIIICILFFILLYKLIKKVDISKYRIDKEIDKKYKNDGKISSMKMNMSKMGIMYRVQDYDLNPSWYILVRITVGVLIGVILYLLTNKIIIIAIGIFAGYIIVPIYFKKKNKDDNEDMMMDLYNTYANFKIQMGAGIYIIDSLEAAHNIANNKRYKEALGELILNFADKTIPTEEAINIFKNRFDNRQIDKLCALLENCIQYGNSEEYAQDIMTEIQSLITANTLKTENDIENKAGLIKFAFFGVIIFLVAYSLYMEFANISLFE